jgi:hypothetical protein
MNPSCTATHALGPAELLHLAARPQRLSVDSGCLWVTQDGEPEDLQIDAGTSRDFDGHARLLVSALGGPARLCVTPLPPLRQPRAARAWAWLPRATAALRGGAAA